MWEPRQEWGYSDCCSEACSPAEKVQKQLAEITFLPRALCLLLLERCYSRRYFFCFAMILSLILLYVA